MNERNAMKKVKMELMDLGVAMWKSIALFVEKLNASPSSIRDLECFKLACSTGLATVGLSQPVALDKDEIVATMSQAVHDEEINNPEWLDAVEKMMSAYKKKVALDNYQPNWDLFGEFNNTQVTNDRNVPTNAEAEILNNDATANGTDSTGVHASENADKEPFNHSGAVETVNATDSTGDHASEVSNFENGL